MKNLLLLTIFFALSISLLAQPWMELIPNEKVNNKQLTFFDYQNAFNEYWQPKNVKDGYYFENGEKHKAGGWKQFKRWEWYWENRVDPLTGEFPNTSAFEVLQKLKRHSGNNKSPGGQWTSMGPSSSPGGYAGLGRLNCIGFHPTDNNTYYVGAASGGVWKTTDNGSNWIAQANDIDAIGISDIIVHATTGNDIVYIATGDRDHSDTYTVGVLRSNDGGTTWLSTGLTFTPDDKELINRLLNDPTDNSIFYAATSDGLYKSTDSCNTWTSINTTTFIDLEFKPGNSNTIYASNKFGDIFISTDAGSTWSTSLNTSGRRTELAVTEDDPTVVYALIAATNAGLFGIYKSTDSGNSFTEVYNSPNLLGWNCNGGDSGGQGWYDLCIAADPNDASTVFIGGVNTWKSTDGGINWNINNHWSSTCGGSATNVHADKHNLTYQNGTSTLFECNDGGLYVSSNDGNTWTHLSNGMIISQMYKLGVAQTTTTDVITGLQDNGTKALLSSSWEDVIGGDGMECLIDWSDENTQYGSIYYGQIYRTTNSWGSSTRIDYGISGNAAWVTPYVQDPNSSNTLYVGYQDVWKSTDQGNTWTQLSSWSGNTLKSLAVAAASSNYIYAATNNILYRTTNGGSSWSDITGTLPISSSNITYIAIKDNDPNTIWVSLSQFNSDGVYESTDGGATWTDISAGLPVLPVNCVIQNKLNTSEVELYAGTDVGVYLKLGTNNWVPFFVDMPNVVVSELDIYYDENTPANSLIRAATYGRGLWESDLYSVPVTLEADFSADNTNVEVEGYVNFTDLSLGSPVSWEWTFEGGTPGTSTVQNPSSIQYNSPGTYDVTLIVYDGTTYDTAVEENYITAYIPAPEADFLADITFGNIPLTVNFSDMSTGDIDTYEWDFGDGNTSTLQNPENIYVTADTFDVRLIVSGPGGTDTLIKENYIITIPEIPIAEFEGDPTSGNSPLEVYFTNLSSGEIDTYQWDFGDGNSSNEENPQHTYSATGDFDVILTVSGPGGNDTIEKENYISVIPSLPVVDFTGDPTSGNTPLAVQFTNLSTGEIDSYQWDFGDGGNSTLPDPLHTYNEPGSYDVSLEAIGPGGAASELKQDYIQITVGVGETDSQKIIVYPNPANDLINIQFENAMSRNIRILSLSGRVLLQNELTKSKESIQLNNIPSGTYYLEIIENENIYSLKFVRN